jgi:DNA-binding CsgD family transcriptional regulator/PAS domain-containing protein
MRRLGREFSLVLKQAPYGRIVKGRKLSLVDLMAALAPARISDLIGLIYDCAIEPSRWPQALAEICRTIECASGIILLLDLVSSRHRFAYTWGLTPDWEQRYFEHSEHFTGFYSRAFSRDVCVDGEPLLLSHLMPRVGPLGQYVYDTWTRPQGLSEMMQTVVLRQQRRLAVFGANRHKSAGELTRDQLTIIRLLVPHIRRAVAIIDILDMKNIEIATLKATLDTFNAGILVVGDEAHILHANNSAREMLAKRTPIAAVNGVLSVRDAQAREELTQAIVLARTDEATIGTNGIAVPLRDEGSAVAHVLPLARGELRTRLVPQATAGVFITQPTDSAARDIHAVAASFNLTPAEARMLEHLAAGATFAEATKALGVSTNTGKTHLARIFSKTGVSRQTDLIALVDRVVPPIHRPEK